MKKKAVGKQFKLNSLIKKHITLNSIIFISFIGVLFFYSYFSKKHNVTHMEKVDKIKKKIEKISKEISDTKSEIINIKSYNNTWQQTDNSKRTFIHVKKKEIYKHFLDIANKYKILDPELDITPSSNVDINKKLGLTRALKVDAYKYQMNFFVLEEELGAKFVKEFLSHVTGYIFYNSITITKSEEYNVGNLKNIAKGKFIGEIKFNIVFYCYQISRINEDSNEKDKEDKDNTDEDNSDVQ